MRYYYFIITLIFVYSCSNLDKRLEAIEEEFGITLPTDYEVIQDDDISFNGFESDYQQIVTIKFEDEGFEDVKRQLEETVYFDQLPEYLGHSLQYPNLLDSNHQIIIDSLARVGQNGTWIKEGHEYTYLDFGEWSDYVHGTLDLTAKTLQWDHSHL